MTGEIIRISFALVFIIGLVFLGARLTRKRQDMKGLMDMVGYYSFGPRKGIAACKVGRELLLISVTQNDIKLIKSYRDEELEPEAVENIKNNIQRLRRIKDSISRQS